MARKTKSEAEKDATKNPEAEAKKPARKSRAASGDGAAAEKPKRKSTAKAASSSDKTTKRAPRKKASAEPSDEAIRQRAYEIYQARGGEHGLHDDDWAQAERELRGK